MAGYLRLAMDMVNTPGFGAKVSYDTEAEPVETERGSVSWHRHALFLLATFFDADRFGLDGCGDILLDVTF